MPGSGKTTLGKLTSKFYDMALYDSDELIEKRMGTTISEIFEHEGEAYFRKLETQIISGVIAITPALISIGGGAVVYNEEMIKSSEHSRVLLIERSLKNISKTLNTDTRPLLKDENALKRLYDSRINIYKRMVDYTIDNNSHIKRAVEQLKKVIESEITGN
jgi:shikimate kinase